MDDRLRELERVATETSHRDDWTRFYAELRRIGRGAPSGVARWEAELPGPAFRVMSPLPALDVREAVELEWLRCGVGERGAFRVQDAGGAVMSVRPWRDAIPFSHPSPTRALPDMNSGMRLDRPMPYVPAREGESDEDLRERVLVAGLMDFSGKAIVIGPEMLGRVFFVVRVPASDPRTALWGSRGSPSGPLAGTPRVLTAEENFTVEVVVPPLRERGFWGYVEAKRVG